jgi:hypothetical protein
LSDKSLRPKEAVACMNCPLAVWMLKGDALECYCRTLYMVVWETSKPGKIKVCDAPEQLRLAAEAIDAPQPLMQTPAFDTKTQSYGLLEPTAVQTDDSKQAFFL